MTWLDAKETCNRMGTYQIDHKTPDRLPRNQVRDFLEEVNFTALNYSFWIGRFRPYINVRIWYRYRNDECVETDRPYLKNSMNGNLTNGQCSVIYRNGSGHPSEKLYVEPCNNKHVFVCNKILGDIKYYVYNDSDINLSSHFDGSVQVEENVTANKCLDLCFKKSNCLSFTFYSDYNSCRFFNRVGSHSSQVNYTIYFQENATHFAKRDCQVSFIPSANLNASRAVNSSEIIPTCGLSQIPEHYYECENDTKRQICAHQYLTETELKEAVNELITNLTIDKASTSKYKRKKVSASDDRTSSMTCGTLAAIIIVLVTILFPLCDYFIPRKMTKSTKHTPSIEMKTINNG
ncbi:hypothetical protein ACF0H5_020160 [Mactra antiquata]